MILDSGPKKNPTDVAIYFTFFLAIPIIHRLKSKKIINYVN